MIISIQTFISLNVLNANNIYCVNGYYCFVTSGHAFEAISMIIDLKHTHMGLQNTLKNLRVCSFFLHKNN